jgi:predicted RecA/RadA family phage recombinase
MAVGDCAGYFLIPAQKATVRVGQEISVHMTEEAAGPSGNRLVPVFPLPHSSRPSVLAAGAVSPDRATGTYRAIRPGQAVLVSRAWCLAGNNEITGSCPVIVVTVLAAASR